MQIDSSKSSKIVFVGRYVSYVHSSFQPCLVPFAYVDTGRLVPLEKCQKRNSTSKKEVHPSHQIIVMTRKNEHWET